MRKFFFWTHLAIGLIAGLIIFIKAVTGIVLAFEPQIVKWSEKNIQYVTPAADNMPRLDVETLLAKATEANPAKKPSGLVLRSEQNSSVAVNFGRDGGMLYINPYTGAALGKQSKVHDFMHEVEDWHRWLDNKKYGEQISGMATAAFLLLLLSGLYLWLKAKLTKLRFGPAGKVRDFNLHNVFGFWFSPAILLVTVTGLVMSTPAPKPNNKKNEPKEELSLNALVEQAQAKSPQWETIFIRLPATVIAREANTPRKFRQWMKPLHTGQAGGILGQIIALLTCLAITAMIWTGFALALRRYSAWRLKAR